MTRPVQAAARWNGARRRDAHCGVARLEVFSHVPRSESERQTVIDLLQSTAAYNGSANEATVAQCPFCSYMFIVTEQRVMLQFSLSCVLSICFSPI